VSQHDLSIANGTGAAVRSDLNGALAALGTNSSGATAPTTTYAYQFWADTTTGLLKIRNAANSAFVTVGTLASTNLGLASLAGATFTGDVILGTTTALELPDGTTGQRPGTPVNGMIRYNTTLNQFEGYKASAWGAIGGGATGGSSDDIFYENGQTVTTNYTLSTGKNAMSAGPIAINSGVTVTVPSGQSWTIV
jgi:hypothetical protein